MGSELLRSGVSAGVPAAAGMARDQSPVMGEQMRCLEELAAMYHDVAIRLDAFRDRTLGCPQSSNPNKTEAPRSVPNGTIAAIGQKLGDLREIVLHMRDTMNEVEAIN